MHSLVLQEIGVPNSGPRQRHAMSVKLLLEVRAQDFVVCRCGSWGLGFSEVRIL